MWENNLDSLGRKSKNFFLDFPPLDKKMLKLSKFLVWKTVEHKKKLKSSINLLKFNTLNYTATVDQLVKSFPLPSNGKVYSPQQSIKQSHSIKLISQINCQKSSVSISSKTLLIFPQKNKHFLVDENPIDCHNNINPRNYLPIENIFSFRLQIKSSHCENFLSNSR